jgi:Ca2+-binding RTX toxin-like protein
LEYKIMPRQPKRPANGSSGQENNGNDSDYFFVSGASSPALSWVQGNNAAQFDLDYSSYVASSINATTYIPLLLQDDHALDGNNTLIFTLKPDAQFGFTQSVYRFKESDRESDSDGTIHLDISPKPPSGPINTFSEAVIIIEDIGIKDSNGVVKAPNIISGTAQSERLTGTAGVDVIYGGSLSPTPHTLNDRGTGNDILEGLAGDDHLYGWDGDDRLDGGAGRDYLLGGAGRDRFELRNPPAATDANPITTLNELSDTTVDRLKNVNVDVIGDFNPTEDTLGIYVDTANGTTIFNQAGLTPNQAIAPEQLSIGQQATTPAQRFIYNRVSGLLSFDADGSGASTAQQIALLSPDLFLSNINIVPFNDQVIPPQPYPPDPPDPIDPTDIPGAINGTNNNDLLMGGVGADILNGKLGNDTLKGKSGKDILVGGGGSDRLTGNKGSDVFVLEAGAGVDRIIDFKDKKDRLSLLSSNIQFQDLKIAQKGQNTLIRLGADRLVFLENTKRNLITAADFTPPPIFPVF